MPLPSIESTSATHTRAFNKPVVDNFLIVILFTTKSLCDSYTSYLQSKGTNLVEGIQAYVPTSVHTHE